MRKLFEYGGIAASVVLIAFGIGSIGIGAWGVSTVRDNLKQEQIFFGDAAEDPAVPASQSGKQVKTGSQAHAFAGVMRTSHARGNQGTEVRRDGALPRRKGQPDFG